MIKANKTFAVDVNAGPMVFVVKFGHNYNARQKKHYGIFGISPKEPAPKSAYSDVPCQPFDTEEQARGYVEARLDEFKEVYEAFDNQLKKYGC